MGSDSSWPFFETAVKCFHGVSTHDVEPLLPLKDLYELCLIR